MQQYDNLMEQDAFLREQDGFLMRLHRKGTICSQKEAFAGGCCGTEWDFRDKNEKTFKVSGCDVLKP
jgi:hypothetical protein